MRPHRRKPTRLPHPWDSPGKNTGVGCHFLLQCRKVKSEREVSQSCPTLSDPMDYSLPGSSIHGIFQARVLEWGAIAITTLCLSFLICKMETVDGLIIECRHKYKYINRTICKKTSLVAQAVKRLSTMRETWVRSLGWEDPLEKEMAIHSSTIAWKIPWTEEPGRLQSLGLQRAGHDLATSLSLSYVKINMCWQYQAQRIYYIRTWYTVINKYELLQISLGSNLIWNCKYMVILIKYCCSSNKLSIIFVFEKPAQVWINLTQDVIVHTNTHTKLYFPWEQNYNNILILSMNFFYFKCCNLLCGKIYVYTR